MIIIILLSRASAIVLLSRLSTFSSHGNIQEESAGKAFGFKPQAWRKKNLRNTTRTMNGYGWRSFCRRQGPACHAPRLRQQFLALEKQNQPLEVQPTLQLAHPLELAPPLDLSPRLDGERLRLHPYSPSGRNGYKKRKGSINRTKSGKGTSGIGK